MEDKAPEVVIVMPAYNAAQTLEMTYRQIPSNAVDEIILVDDRSRDGTIEVAKKLNLKVFSHLHNLGYGGNQKTCYTEALRENAEVIIMLHPDGQYDPSVIPDMIKPIKDGEADIVLGSRFLIKRGARKGGMPFYKFIANKFLTGTQNFVLGLKVSEYHTGYRAYSRRFLETVPFLRNSNGFIFDQEIMVQMKIFNLRLKEISIKTKYFKEASEISFYNSIIYGFKTLFLMVKYLLFKWGIVRFPIFLD